MTPNERSAAGVLADAARAWRRSPCVAAAALACLVVQQAFATGFALSLKPIVEDIAKHRSGGPLLTIVIALVVGFVVAAVAALVGERAAAVGAARLVNELRRELYDHLLRLSPTYYLTTTAGEIVKRFQSDLNNLERGYVQGFLDVAVLAIGSAITIPVMWWLDWRLTLIAVVGLAGVLGVVNKLLPRWIEAEDANSEAELDVVNLVQDTIRAQQVIRVFHLEEVLRGRLDARLSASERRSVRARGTAATIARGAGFGVLLVQLISVVTGAELAAHQVISASTLVAFTILIGVSAKNVYDVARTDLLLLAAARRGSRGIDQLRAVAIAVSDREGAMPLNPVQDSITFDRVTFAYAQGRNALEDISFTISHGSNVAIVGPNGSGKTTLLNLLMRIHDPQHGAVLIDDTDVRQVTQRSLREQLAVVLQANYIFNDTIRENIRIGRPDAPDTDVEAAARQIDLHSYAATLPLGYDTVVGDGGGSLSGGHRQRLAIARAVIREPRVLLLDEATTALDPATEDTVSAMLTAFGATRTLISVTHRLSLSTGADQILVLDRGRLVGRGTHQELLAGCATYCELWQKQSGFDVSEDGRRATVTPERLAHITLFSDLEPGSLAGIASLLSSEYYDAGETVFTHGDVGDRFYLIARGKVAVTVPREDGGEHLLETLGDGDHFGELAMLQDRPRTATIRTLVPSVLLTMSRTQFLTMVATTTQLGPALEQRMARSELNLEEWRRLVGQARPS